MGFVFKYVLPFLATRFPSEDRLASRRYLSYTLITKHKDTPCKLAILDGFRYAKGALDDTTLDGDASGGSMTTITGMIHVTPYIVGAYSTRSPTSLTMKEH